MDDFDIIRIFNFRLRVESILNSRYGHYMETVSCLLSLMSSTLYVMNTYMASISFMIEIDIIIILLYCFEYSLKLYVSQHRIQFLTEIWSIVDLSCIIPIAFIFTNFSTSQAFVTFLNITRIFRFLRVVRYI